jgi:fatty-acid desaturase
LFALFSVTLANHRYWTHRGFEARFPLQPKDTRQLVAL